MTKTNADVAIETRTKFEGYLLALIFGILGLSVQTAKFGQHLVPDILELAGWLALFVAGIVALLRGEWVPVAYEIQHKALGTEEYIKQLEQGIAAGSAQTITFTENGEDKAFNLEQFRDKLRATLKNLEGQRDRADARIRFRYRVLKWAFMVGIACLLLARGFQPALDIARRLAA